MEEEKQTNRNLELELENIRKRLLTFARRSVPRRSKKRVARRIGSCEDGTESTILIEGSGSSSENEQHNVNKLIAIMTDEL